MDIQMLTDFLMWCTIINVGLMIISFLFCVCAGDFVYKIHSKMFPLSKKSFYRAIYSLFGFFKIIIIVFNVVPYIALLIIK